MQLMSDNAEEAIRLLTQVAEGDVALVRQVLVKHKGADASKIIAYIRAAVSSKGRLPPGQSRRHPDPATRVFRR